MVFGCAHDRICEYEFSLVLNGASHYVSTPFVGIGGNAQRTVSFWVKTNAVGGNGIVAWGDSAVNGAKWHVRLNDNAANGPVGAIRTETQGDFTIGAPFSMMAIGIMW